MRRRVPRTVADDVNVDDWRVRKSVCCGRMQQAQLGSCRTHEHVTTLMLSRLCCWKCVGPEQEFVRQRLLSSWIAYASSRAPGGPTSLAVGCRLHMIDAGASSAYGGSIAVWRCVNGQAAAVHPGGSSKY